jgi:sialate O-acetylesterase
MKDILDYLIKKRYADPGKVFVCGSSRGGYLGLQFAAVESRVRSVAAFAPCIDLLVLREFAGVSRSALLPSFNLDNTVEALTKKDIWMVIGDRDDRVGTDTAIKFSRRISQALKVNNAKGRIEMDVMWEPKGHTTPKGAVDRAVSWLLESAERTNPSLKPAAIFSDHMVLQRNRLIPVWGKATPGAAVQVDLDGAVQTVATGSDGAWRADFPPRTASTKPIWIQVSANGDTSTFRDVLVGDVWFCSGQSNLGVTVSGAKNAALELKNADHPNLRLYTIPTSASWNPGDTPSYRPKGSPDPVWNVCTPANAAVFAAVGYVFGSELLKKLDVPIGVINSAFGGAFIEPFIPREVIKKSGKFPKAQEIIKRTEAITDDEMRTLETQSIKWNDDRQQASVSVKSVQAGWQLPDFDDSKWATMPMPGFWQESAKLKIDGTVWFRRTLHLDASQAGADRFSFGYLRMAVRVWINGKEVSVAPETVGLSGISYAIPPGTLKAGDNTIAFRIYSMYGIGGLKKINKEDFSLQQVAHPRVVLTDLAGDWRYGIEAGIPQTAQPMRQGRTDYAVPGVIWNAMVLPVVPFPVRGIVWYQGESNVNRPDEYAELLPLLINTWRSEWKDPAMPFLIVQLPNYQPHLGEPAESNWARLRAAQDTTLRLPNTGMVVTYDVGDEKDLHPRNKRPVGERLALLAENMVYRTLKPAVARSPRAISAKYSGAWVEVHFDPGVTLKTKDGQPPREIAIAGADGKFVWAKAKIKGTVLLISTENSTTPKYIRYAWADNPDANLTSEAGLPVAPFGMTIED